MRLTWVLTSGSLTLSAMATVSSGGSTGEGSAFKLSHPAVGRIQFPECCWTEGLRSSLAVGGRPLSGPCCVGFCQVATNTLTMEVMTHLLCHVLSLRSKSLCPAPIPGRDYTHVRSPGRGTVGAASYSAGDVCTGHATSSTLRP